MPVRLGPTGATRSLNSTFGVGRLALGVFCCRSSHIILRRATMLEDELAGIQPSSRVRAITGSDERRRELAHFKMQVSEIMTIGGTDGGDLLTALNLLIGINEDLFHVRVI